MSRNTEFNRHFQEVIERARGKSTDVVRAVALELLTGVVEKSPVDTGRLKSNWQVGLGRKDTTVTSPPGDDPIARGLPKIMQFNAGQKIYLTNSLPYARPLEFGMFPNPPKGGQGKTSGGFSAQAKAGMVRITIVEYNQKLREIVAKLREQQS